MPRRRRLIDVAGPGRLRPPGPSPCGRACATEAECAGLAWNRITQGQTIDQLGRRHDWRVAPASAARSVDEVVAAFHLELAAGSTPSWRHRRSAGLGPIGTARTGCCLGRGWGCSATSGLKRAAAPTAQL
jgi:hypothetical protein